MRDASSPGRGNNSTEIVTDVHVSVIRFLNHDRFFFFFFRISLDEIRYYRVFFFFYVEKEGVV